MSQAEGSSRRQKLMRAVAPIITTLAIGPALLACGWPQAAAWRASVNRRYAH